MTVNATYPHQHPSFRPLPLSGDAIASLADTLRRHLCSVPHRPKVDLEALVRRSRRLLINGIKIELRLEMGGALHDDDGNLALGVTQHDGSRSSRVDICLNGPALDGDEPLARSTLLHELGHAVLDAPSWIVAAHSGPAPVIRKHYLRPQNTKKPRSSDWREWRANAFMGAFLCPKPMLHQWMVKRAAALDLVMVPDRNSEDLPLVSSALSDCHKVDALIFDLAEIFGLSPRFIETRLSKYRLVSGC